MRWFWSVTAVIVPAIPNRTNGHAATLEEAKGEISRGLGEGEGMVNLDDPKEFFRVIVDPNLHEFYANEGDLRSGVNSILTLDALVGVLHQETCRKTGAGPNDKDDKFRDEHADKSGAYRVVRDAAAAVKHGSLNRQKQQQRVVLEVRNLTDFRVGAGTMRAGEDRLGNTVVYVVLPQVGRADRLSGVLRSAAGYISQLL